MKKQFLIFIPILIVLVIVIYIFFNYKIHNDDKPSRNIKSLNESEETKHYNESNTDYTINEPSILNNESNTDSRSYWFVLAQDQEGILYNSITSQNHSYFSIKDAKSDFGGNEEIFILDFKKIELVDSSITTSTYWFIVCSTGDSKINGMMEQKHLYFSFDEAKNFFNENGDKTIFILNYTQISKETYFMD